MARNNNYNNNFNAPRSWDAPQNFQQNFNNGGRISEPKKRSGAKQGMITKGKNRDKGYIYLSAWKANKRFGMVTVKGFENDRSKRSEAPTTGARFVTIMLEISFVDQGNVELELVSYNLTTGKAYIEKFGWVLSTKARNGGYLGKISKR